MGQPLPAVKVGVGVILVDSREEAVLVGKRKAAHGAGEYALPGGHLEVGETFEQCASRELREESGIDLDAARFEFAYALNCIFPNGAHYVTVFMAAASQRDEDGGWETWAPVNAEPHKCEGWEWANFVVRHDGAGGRAPLRMRFDHEQRDIDDDELFLPLRQLLEVERGLRAAGRPPVLTFLSDDIF